MNALQICQSRWDNMLPTDHDNDATQSELMEATDQFRTDTWATSDWLARSLQQAEGDTTSTREWWGKHDRADIDVSDATVDQLWVLIIDGTEQQCLAAREELRDRMIAGCAADIEARVPAIRAANIAESREYQADCYRDDPHHWY